MVRSYPVSYLHSNKLARHEQSIAQPMKLASFVLATACAAVLSGIKNDNNSTRRMIIVIAHDDDESSFLV